MIQTSRLCFPTALGQRSGSGVVAGIGIISLIGFIICHSLSHQALRDRFHRVAGTLTRQRINSRRFRPVSSTSQQLASGHRNSCGVEEASSSLEEMAAFHAAFKAMEIPSDGAIHVLMRTFSLPNPPHRSEIFQWHERNRTSTGPSMSIALQTDLIA